MLCAPLDWKYAEFPSSASDAVLCSVLVRRMWETNREKKRKKRFASRGKARYGKHKIIIQKLFKAQNPCFDNNLGAR